MVCAGWSPSGVYHIGNSREAVSCNAFNLELIKLGADSKFIFVIDDFDSLDKLPAELKKYNKELRKYLGHPINRIPDFTGTADSYADYFAKDAKKALTDWGFEVEYVNASDLYKEGKYDEFLDLYLENEEKLQTLIENVSGSPLDSLISIICQNCGNSKTTIISEFTIDQTFKYTCKHNQQYRGCDFEGELDIASHEWKLKWRLDWPARQKFLGVTIEPSGKDHSVAGGSVDSALKIHEEIFERNQPMLLRYGFITIKGKKFSGSKGGALAASRIIDIMPPSAYLYLVYRNDMLKDINFNPESNEYGLLLDEFDVARRMRLGEKFEGRDREVGKLITAVELAMNDDEIDLIPGSMKFAELVLVHLTSLRNSSVTIKKLENLGKIVHESSKQDLLNRLPRIEKWIDELAPETIKFTILDTNPDDIDKYWTVDMKNLWIESLKSILDSNNPDDFVKSIRNLGLKYNLTPKQFFLPFYKMILGTERGPNAANLIYAIGKTEILERVENIIL